MIKTSKKILISGVFLGVGTRTGIEGLWGPLGLATRGA